MKILVYCQHVLGIGHLSRMALILEHLAPHQVTLVLGGPPAHDLFPPFVRVVRLPGLRMDAGFGELLPVDPARSLKEVKNERRALLLALADEVRPDLLLVELFPFGRCGFRFELDPLLAHVRASLPACRLVSSVRDILVERDNREKFERRALERLNRFFDLVLVHADPRVIRFEESFSRLDEMKPTLHYTGYVARSPEPGAGARLRQELGLAPEQPLVVVSAGGGSVGAELLRAAVRAHGRLTDTLSLRTCVFTGPYLDQDEFIRLQAMGGPGVRLRRFSDRFPAWLAAADLSLSLAGYNTTMNVVAAGCPGLFLPFAQNREQRLRLERRRSLLPLTILEPDQLAPSRLAALIQTRLGRRNVAGPGVNLHGGPGSAAILCRQGAER